MLFVSLVQQSMKSRKMRTRGMPVEALVRALRSRLEAEEEYQTLTDATTHAKIDEDAIYAPHQVVSCILHLEMRVAEKMVEAILRRGLALANNQTTFVREVELHVKTQILCGTNGAEGIFHLPVDRGTGENGRKRLGTISFSKFRARRFMDNLDDLIDYCMPGDDADSVLSRDRIKLAVADYSHAMVILGQKTNYTDNDINQFQEKIDSWFATWVYEFGSEALTNYTHLLSSGHIREEMEDLGNLYRYSQEGVEAMIGLMKNYFFRRTMRGGGRSKDNGDKMLPLAKWLQRRMFFLLKWRTGFSLQVCEGETIDTDIIAEEEYDNIGEEEDAEVESTIEALPDS